MFLCCWGHQIGPQRLWWSLVARSIPNLSACSSAKQSFSLLVWVRTWPLNFNDSLVSHLLWEHEESGGRCRTIRYSGRHQLLMGTDNCEQHPPRTTSIVFIHCVTLRYAADMSLYLKYASQLQYIALATRSFTVCAALVRAQTFYFSFRRNLILVCWHLFFTLY